MIYNQIAPAYREIIEAILGEDLPADMQKTPERFANACSEWFAGYDADLKSLLTEATFESDGLDQYKGMVTVKAIEFYSHCEHHGAPFFGTVDIVVIPKGKVLGISKFARLTDAITRRFQTQERITQQIANAIMEHLAPVGVMVVVNARHMCMCSRGINKQHSMTSTSVVLGAFRDEPSARAEAQWLINR